MPLRAQCSPNDIICRPNIVHAHDWPTAPVCFGNLASARSVFTIHNLNYGADLIGRAMSGAAVGTTVSPTYAAEVSYVAISMCPTVPQQPTKTPSALSSLPSIPTVPHLLCSRGG